MQHLWNRFIRFLFADVKNEKETKDLAVLIRINCILFSIYFFVTGIIMAYIHRYTLGLVMSIAVGLTVGAFIFTYENRTAAGLILLNAVVLTFPTILSLFNTYEAGYQYIIFMNILLIYFNKAKHPMSKRIYSASLMLLIMLLIQFCSVFPYYIKPKTYSMIFIQSFNILIMGSCMLATAYCYSVKFNQSEDKLRRINENLERMANLDTLTGLSNRRHMNEYLSGVVYEYNRSGKIFTMAIGDIDFFKKVNDTYGHDTGDYVLTTMADIFKKFMKNKGQVARWGGEEFLFAFEEMKIEKASAELEALRKEIEQTPIQFKDYDFKVTMTFGMEEYNPRMGIEATINRADNKLYEGKTGGRNRVVV